ncbi:transposase [Streptomyces sp. JV184]|uniref:transposase n=1 Tax=Streptomyces sp. JV184 TaxID=858637 RepID=UPI002E765420|nr:transposase [Streptomyces sp. JV184]MEE1745273.1 transposase [Streptomyces sp. JV184]
MSDAEWAVVRDAMPIPAWMNGKGGQPECYCHLQMLDAVRYLVAGGITWRAMPGDFPVWGRVYAFARRWGAQGLLAELHDRLRGLVRQEAGRDPEPTAAIVDSQSVRAAATVPAPSRGYDAMYRGSWCCRGAGAWSGRSRGCSARAGWYATTRRCPPSTSGWSCGR